MSTPVQLYVYDLSNGMARQLSLQLTGRQIDGIWHTSVVVFEKEIFYGQGISITQPGKSHHGSPLQAINMGETAIDQETFEEYIAAMRETYTADKYHLLDFNCNSFTNDCLGFLTGGSLPSYIKSLPSDFLSTPFGQALRPTIDAMFTNQPRSNEVLARPALASTNSPSPDPTMAAGLLESVAAQATAAVGGPSTTPAPASRVPASALPAAEAPLSASMHITTNPASFQSLLQSHRAVVAFFTSATCGPCRMIEPVFEELAKSKSRATGGVGFTKIDLSVGMSGAVAREYKVRVTPTFVFFLDGKKTHVLQGVNAPELKTQVDLLIYEAFPPHAHTRLQLPAMDAISLDPILFKQVPNLDALFNKLAEFVDGATGWTGGVGQAQAKEMLRDKVKPFLKACTAESAAKQAKWTGFDGWAEMTLGLEENLGANALFPVVDIWRLALLNTSFAAWSAKQKMAESPMERLMNKARAEDVPRSYLLTVVRMMANAFSNEVLAREVIIFAREGVTGLVVEGLQHEDAAVRTAAASLVFNIGAYVQRQRVGRMTARDDEEGAEENEDWEVEVIVGVLEGIRCETGSEETVHRLAACLGLLLRLSPYTESLSTLLETLQVRELLEHKATSQVVKKDSIRKLVQEVAEQLT